MSDQAQEQKQRVGNRFFRMINGETIFGDTYAVPCQSGAVEFLIKKPYTVVSSKMMPYMLDELGEAPGAVQLHPMNVLWSVPLDEFKKIDENYVKATSSLILPN